jgi:hypothetical protein
MPDGSRFPPQFGYGILHTAIGGVKSLLSESDPLTYFTILDGEAFYKYEDIVVGGVHDEHGLVTSLGNMAGKDVRFSIILDDPRIFWKATMEEFLVELTIGWSKSNESLSWIGGMARLHYSGGSWLDSGHISAVQSINGVQSILETEIISSILNINDFVTLFKDGNLRVSWNGVDICGLEDVSQDTGPIILSVKVIGKAAGVWTPYPIISKISYHLYLSGINLPVKEIPGMNMPLTPDGSTVFYNIPVADLENEGVIVRENESTWLVIVEKTFQLEDGRPIKIVPGTRFNSFRDDLVDSKTKMCKFKYL